MAMYGLLALLACGLLGAHAAFFEERFDGGCREGRLACGPPRVCV